MAFTSVSRYTTYLKTKAEWGLQEVLSCVEHDEVGWPEGATKTPKQDEDDEGGEQPENII